jgi:hypothetical protein
MAAKNANAAMAESGGECVWRESGAMHFSFVLVRLTGISREDVFAFNLVYKEIL